MTLCALLDVVLVDHCAATHKHITIFTNRAIAIINAFLTNNLRARLTTIGICQLA